MKMKNKGLFVLNIENTQNATWQGTVTWIDKQKKQCFRSELELLKMIECALEENESRESDEIFKYKQ